MSSPIDASKKKKILSSIKVMLYDAEQYFPQLNEFPGKSGPKVYANNVKVLKFVSIFKKI